MLTLVIFFTVPTFSSLIDGFETGLNDPFQQLPKGILNWVRETCLQETNIVSCMQHVGGNKWVTRPTYYSARNGKVNTVRTDYSILYIRKAGEMNSRWSTLKNKSSNLV